MAREINLFGATQQPFNLGDGRFQGRTCGHVEQSKYICGDQKPARCGCPGRPVENCIAHGGQQIRRARKPAHDIKARRQGHHPGHRHPTVGRPNAIDAAKARRRTYRSTGIGPQSKIDQSGGHGGSRP